MSELAYCPFCNKSAVPITRGKKTVRNASRQGRSVGHIEEQLIVLGDCQNCKKAAKEIQKAFDV